MAYPTFDCFYGADLGIAIKKMSDDLVLNTILLCYEGERDSMVLVELGIGGGVKGWPPITKC